MWFFGVAPTLYLPVFPVFVVGEDPTRQEFHLQVADLPANVAELAAADSPTEEWARRYHAAYDADLLGISLDLRVDVQADVRRERDGPMLRHGLQDLHGGQLRLVPHSPAERPDPGLLAQRWQRYRDAG